MKRTNKKVILNVIAVFLVLIFLVSAAFFGIELWEKNHSEFENENSFISDSTLDYNGKTYEKKKDIDTFLVLGLDKISDAESFESYSNDKQSDFVVLFVFDNEEKTCNVLHINRDTVAQIDVLGVAGDKIGEVNKQIALAHTYGNGKEVSCRNVANSLSKLLLGVNVEHYLSFTMDAVPTATDLVGGVEITVLDDFSAINPALVKGEKIRLNGELALTYVRSRSGLDDASNNARMKRQAQFIKAFYESLKIKMDEDTSFASNAYMNISSYIVSDCNSARLESILKKASEYTFGEIYKLEGREEVKDNYLEFYPSEESIKETVIDLFYNEK